MAFSVDGLVNKGFQKAVDYGNKVINDKINFGLNYARNFIRQYDVLGILPEAWTLLDETGEKAFEFDAFMTAEIKLETKITTAPVEEASFASYNLAVTPMEIKCVLAKQGMPEDLTVFADALIQYAQGTDLLSIVTPEREYENMKLLSVSFGRSAETGTDIIYAECDFQEVRLVMAEYSDDKLAVKKSRGLQKGGTTGAGSKGPVSVLSAGKGLFK